MHASMKTAYATQCSEVSYHQNLQDAIWLKTTAINKCSLKVQLLYKIWILTRFLKWLEIDFGESERLKIDTANSIS